MTSGWKFEAMNGFNNELEYYLPQAVYSPTGKSVASISDGALHLTAYKVTPTAQSNWMEYVSARLNSRQAWKYGYFEARIKLPPDQKGIWPAFWMLKEGGPAYVGDGGGEIDIMEWVGSEPQYNNFSVHSNRATFDGQPIIDPDTGKAVPYTTQVTISNRSEYHCYGVLWTHEAITGYLDGQVMLRVPNPIPSGSDVNWWPYDARYYMLLNLAVGGTWPGNPPSTFTSATFDVDWVRVYQKQ